MKKYTLDITDEVLADMEQLYNHIAYTLLAPENAMGQHNRIADEILKIDIFPESFRIMWERYSNECMYPNQSSC